MLQPDFLGTHPQTQKHTHQLRPLLPATCHLPPANYKVTDKLGVTGTYLTTCPRQAQFSIFPRLGKSMGRLGKADTSPFSLPPRMREPSFSSRKLLSSTTIQLAQSMPRISKTHPDNQSHNKKSTRNTAQVHVTSPGREPGKARLSSSFPCRNEGCLCITCLLIRWGWYGVIPVPAAIKVKIIQRVRAYVLPRNSAYT